MKNLEIIENVFFMSLKKTDFAQKKVLVCWRRPIDASKHTNTFRQNFYNFFAMLTKIHLLSFQDFLYDNLLILINNGLVYCSSFKETGNKWLWIYVNRKTRFSEVQQIPKAKQIKKNLPKIFLSDIVKKLLILFVIKKTLWIISANLHF